MGDNTDLQKIALLFNEIGVEYTIEDDQAIVLERDGFTCELLFDDEGIYQYYDLYI